MILTIHNILLIGSILLFISIIAGKSSYRLGIPALLLFLIIGMLSGSEGIGGIYFDNPNIAQFIGIVALNFILFSGGLDTEWRSVKPILWQGVMLSTAGVLITAVLTGWFVSMVTGFSILEGMLVGSIVSSTDAASVFSILGSNHLHLKDRLRPTLELESGSNDPMAYMLTTTFLGLVLDPETSIGLLVFKFIRQILLGLAAGFLFGKLSVWLVNRIKLGFDALYPVLLMAIMLFTFSCTETIGGNGFLAVYLSALYFTNRPVEKRHQIIQFFDGIGWLMQIVLFLTLGLLVFPKDIIPVIGTGLMISLFLIIIARPASVFLSLLFFKTRMRNKLFISWVGLRGAVPIVFATYPLIAGIGEAGMIFNIVFFISLTSVLIQGTTLPFAAKWLKVIEPNRSSPKKEIDLELNAGSEVLEIILSAGNPVIGKKIKEIGFPDEARITLIKRDGENIIPTGDTVLKENDLTVIFCQNKRVIPKVYHLLE